ncbi:MAG: CotH kinase family protein [Candidatus Zhuqueibacterota bacterium]
MKSLYLRALLLALPVVSFGQFSPSVNSLKPATNMPVCEMFISPENLAKLNEDVFSDEYVPADVVIEGVRFTNVGIRYRGLTSRDAPKKSYKINFKSSNRYHGRDKMNFKAEYCDKSLMREFLSYQLLDVAGLHAARTRFVHLRLNGVFLGVYLDVENIDEFFLHDHAMDERGNLYKAAGENDCTLSWRGDSAEDYMPLYEKKTNESESWDDFIDFVGWINFASDEEFAALIETKLDLERYVEWIAVNHIVENFDVYQKNYYLYHDSDTDRWEVIPYDYDYAFGHGELPNMVIDNPLSLGKQNVLFRRIYDTPHLQARMKTSVIKNLNSLFNTGAILPAIDSAFQFIQADAYLDTFKAGTNAEFDFHYEWLREFVGLRTEFILNELTPERLYINEFLADNRSVYADEYGEFDGWIEIYNPSDSRLNLKYYYLTDDLNDPEKWALPDTAIAGHGSLLIWADGQEEQGALHTNFMLDAGGGAVGIFLEQHISDAIEFGQQTADLSLGRSSHDRRCWRNFQYPTPGEDELTLACNLPEAGWYLFSLPVETADNRSTSLFPAGSVVYAWQDSGYSRAETLEPGRGYWLNLPEAATITVAGNRIFSYQRHLSPGWHLVAAPGQSTTIAGITTQPEGSLRAVQAWDANGESYTPAAQLSPFEAGWIYLDQESHVTFGISRADSGKTLAFSDLPPAPPYATSTSQMKDSVLPDVALFQNYPNPFNAATTFHFSVSNRSHVTATLLDLTGREVVRLADTVFEAGNHSLHWDCRDGRGNALPSGIYFCRVEAGRFRAAVKSILLR